MGRSRAPYLRRRAVKKYSDVFVGLDTSKLKISVALAEDGRSGDVRFYGDIGSSGGSVTALIKKLAKPDVAVAFLL